MNAVQIPGYELLDKLGEGGMAAVWKARQTRLNRIVAVKILRARISEKPGELERFKHEAMAAANLNHANVVQVIDAGEHEGRAYTVMEYIAGCNLADWLDARGPLEPAQALDIATDAAHALAYGWNQHRMVHCDIKPENILLHESGVVKIADLGIAQMAGFTDVRVEDGYALGTPHYMSPEQAMHDRRTLDCRADIYSLGATLHHMLTGAMPFAAVPMEKVLEQQVRGFLPDLAELRPGLPPGLPWLVERLLAREPAHRHQSWEEVLTDMELVRGGFQIQNPLRTDGLSTMRRHPSRPPAPVSTAPAPKPARGKSLIRLSMQDQQQISEIHGRHGGGLNQARTAATVLAGVVFAAYAYTGFVSAAAWQDSRPRALPAEEPAEVAGLPAGTGAGNDLFSAPQAPPVPDPADLPKPGAEGQRKFLETLKAMEGRGQNAGANTNDNPFLAQRQPRRPRPERTNTVAAVTQAPAGNSATSPGPDPFAEEAALAAETAPAPAVIPAEPPREWNDPTYRQARELLKRAQETYGRAMADRKNVALWRSVEADVIKAQTLFQGLRSYAPPEADVNDLYRQATKILFDVHQVMRVLE